MAETTITPTTIDTTGVDQPAALVAANADGSKFANTGNEFIMVENGGGGDITVTVVTQDACSLGGTTVHNIAKIVSAGAGASFGPFPKANYNDTAGDAHITFSGVTSVTVAVFKLDR
jgi:hypothetical protein